MKSILLTTTAIVAFAGAAAAEGHTGVSFSGSTVLGYNDDSDNAATPIGDYSGFYWEGNLAVSMSAELDNGLTAGASFDTDFVIQDDVGPATTTLGEDLASGGFVLSLESENAGLYLGDVAFAAETRWKSAGDMEADGFSEADGETALRADAEYGNFAGSLSYVLADSDGEVVGDNGSEDVDQLSIGVAADFGMFSMTAAYQEEAKPVGAYDGTNNNGDFSNKEIFGISGSAAVAGADITVAYAQESALGLSPEETSIGVKVAYPFGPVTATAYYVAEEGTDLPDEDPNYGINVAYSDGPIAVSLDYQDDQGVQKVGLDGSYDVGNGLTILAGVFDQSDSPTATDDGTDSYVAAVYDMGGGAELLVSYADAESNGAIVDDEVGGPDYQVGTTVAVSFSF
ncbi:porin [Yoonia sp.]|uniref:porin n=1 Tax=Yoonia sp. TaxID=2212373 RepID=UPI003F6C22EF